MFRQIQFFLKLHRNINSVHVLQNFLVCVAICGTTILYVCIRLIPEHVQLNWSMQVMATQGLFECYCILIFVAFRYFGNMYDVSNRRQAILHKGTQNRKLRAFFRSCPVQRIYCGGSNYFEPITSLNVGLFVFNQTVSLILVTKH